MKYVSFLCVLFSGLLSTVALGKPDRSSHVATQAEVEQDSFLRGTARNLEKSDVVLSVIIYKKSPLTRERRTMPASFSRCGEIFL